MTEKPLPIEIEEQDRQIPITPEGFFDLSRFAGVLPENVWNLSDDEFALWAEKQANLQEGEPVLLARFHRPKQGEFAGRMVTHDLGKSGVLVMDEPGATTEVHLPYVVKVVGETNQYSQLRLVRKPNLEDCVRYLRQREGKERRIEIQQISFRTIVSREDESPVMGREPGGRKTFLRKNLSPEVKNSVIYSDDRVVAVEPTEESRKYSFCVPIAKARVWERTSVSAVQENGTPIPVVSTERFYGIDSVYTGVKRIGWFDSLANVLPDLSPENQAILARLWNVYRRKELDKQNKGEELKKQIAADKHEAWEAYEDGRVVVERDRRYREIGEDGEEHDFVPVLVDGERYDIEPYYPDGTRTRYGGNWKAYTAAEAFAIVDSDRYFLESLSREKGIQFQPGLIADLRPDSVEIDIDQLAHAPQYTTNGFRWGREPIARDHFKRLFESKIVEFESNAVKLTLEFSPCLYEQTTVGQQDGGIEPVPVVEYRVAYLLSDEIVQYDDRILCLRDHVEERVEKILNKVLSELHKPAWIPPDDGRKVRWLAGQEWASSEIDGEADDGIKEENEV